MPGAGMVVEVSSALPLNYRSVEVTHFDEDETHQNYFFFNEQKLQFPIDKLKDSKTKLIFTAHFLSGPSCLKHGSRQPALTTIERYKFRYFLANGKRSSCFEQPPPAVFSCPFSWRSELHIRHSICNTMMWLKFKAWTRMKPCVGRLDYFSYQL